MSNSSRTNPGRQPIPHVVCAGCSCLCDDIEIETDGPQVVEARNACALGKTWLAAAPSEGPACSIAGRPATLAEGLDRAAEILAAARYPLIYGLEQTSTPGQRAAVALADRLRGVLDTTSSSSHGASIRAVQAVGKVTCTLGEIRHRCDLIVCWGADPETTHPRLLSRYSLFPRGMFVPNGRSDRKLVVVDSVHTATADLADVFLPIPSDRHFEGLWTLRALASGCRLDAGLVERQTGLPLATWQGLLEQMLAARFGSLLYGPATMQGPGGHRNALAALALVRDLNRTTRFVGRSLRGCGNASGADQVLLWQTGYPFAIDFTRGYPRHEPEEYSAERLLRRGEPDAALVVAASPAGALSAAALRVLHTLPLVTVGATDQPTAAAAAVRFATARYAVESGGTVYRMDEVPLSLRPFRSTSLATEADILGQIEQRVRMLQNRAVAATAPADLGGSS